MNDDEKLLKIFEIETNRINHLDTILFNIKVWTITLISVVIGFVLKSQVSTNLPGGAFSFMSEAKFLWLAMGATILFFSIDYNFRKIQLRNVQNTIEIRKYLKSMRGAET